MCSGNDRDSEYHYALGSSRMDMRALSKAMNSRLSAEGAEAAALWPRAPSGRRGKPLRQRSRKRQNYKGWYDGIKQRYNEKIRGLIVFTVVIVVAGINYRRLVDVAAGLMHIVWPFILGAAIAFILNVPMRNIEEAFDRVWGRAAG